MGVYHRCLTLNSLRLETRCPKQPFHSNDRANPYPFLLCLLLPGVQRFLLVPSPQAQFSVAICLSIVC